MNAPKLSHKEVYVIIGGVILIGLGFYIYSQGKKSVPPAQANLPAPISSGGTDSNANLSTIANAIYEDAYVSLDIADNHNEDPYNQFLALDDDGAVQLYNVFNALYQQQIGETLTKLISSKWSIPFTAWATTQAAVLARLSALNLQ